MKRRLRQPPLPKMKFTFACEKTIAEKPARSFQPAALMKILLIGDEYVPDQVRMAEEVDVLRANSPVCDVTVLLLHRYHHGERIACNLHHELAGIA